MLRYSLHIKGNGVVDRDQENHSLNKNLRIVGVGRRFIASAWITYWDDTHCRKCLVDLCGTSLGFSDEAYDRYSYVSRLSKVLVKDMRTNYLEQSKGDKDRNEHVRDGSHGNENTSCEQIRLRYRVYSHYKYRYRHR